MIMWCFSLSFFFYVVDYIDGFQYTEPSLHPWHDAYLIMADYQFDVFLDSIGQIFIVYFHTNVKKGN